MNIENIFVLLLFFICFLIATFLFWRAGRRELEESQHLFDFIFIFILGALIMGRFSDFFNRPEYYGLSIRKLIFFNAFSGFNFWGAFLGGIVSVYLYMGKKRDKVWYFFDLAASGILFAASFFLIGKFLLLKYLQNKTDFWLLILGGLYFILFFIFKRLEKQKKHLGFFTGFMLVSVSLLNLIYYTYDFYLQKNNKSNLPFLFFTSLFFLSGIFWYLLSKRKIKEDIKKLFASFLLVVFKTFRTLTNISEADSVAKNIVLSPLMTFKVLVNLVKLIGREVRGAIFDFAGILGLRK